MNLTPPKIPPLPLSPKHQRSVEKSKAINEKVDSFVKSNFKDSPGSSDGKMIASSESLSNTKAFFESEIKLVMKMVEQSNKLYKQKENQNVLLHKKLNEYEQKIVNLQEAAIDCTVNKGRDQNSVMDEKDERKTRKKGLNEEVDKCKGLSRAISEFNISRVHEQQDSEWRRQMQEKHKDMEKKMKYELQCKKREVQILNGMLRQEKQKIEKVTIEKNQYSSEIQKTFLAQYRAYNQLRTLISQNNLLQERYTELEDKHGTTVAQYEIKLKNLKQILKGIKENNSPTKLSQNQTEGYYSINKPLNRNESHESLESFSTSKYMTPSHVEINLKEQNEYLRTQLIRVLDQKGALQIKTNKYKKLAIKFESIAKTAKQSKPQLFYNQNQNNKFLSNIDIKETEKSEKSFKKKRNTSILLVQDTQKKEKELLEQQKIKKLVKEINQVLHLNKSSESRNEIKQNSTQSQVLQNLLAKLKGIFQQLVNLRKVLQKTQDEKQALVKEKLNLEEKSKKDAYELKKYLKESSGNLTTPKSEDSTDKAFKYIKLIEISPSQPQLDQANNFQQFSKSMLPHHIESVVTIQENEMKILKQKITSLEQTISTLEKCNQKNLPHAKMNEEVKESQIVPYSPVGLQSNQYDAEYSPFEMFKQKLTQFYQHTIKQLDDWSNSAIKNITSPIKKLPEIQQQQNQHSSPYQIPKIVNKNIMKMSQEFQSIKNSSFDNSTILKNEEYGNNLFRSQKLSKSFIKNESEAPSQTFEEIINKKLEGFQQFSSNWIEKHNAKDADKKDSSQQSQQVQDLTLKQEFKQLSQVKIMNGSKTDRSAVENRNLFETEMDEIDAFSDWMTDEEFLAERKIFIREEVSYFVKKIDLSSIRDMNGSSSKRSFKSFEV